MCRKEVRERCYLNCRCMLPITIAYAVCTYRFSPYRFLLWFEQPALDMILWHKKLELDKCTSTESDVATRTDPPP